jgi:hypothetical protein
MARLGTAIAREKGQKMNRRLTLVITLLILVGCTPQPTLPVTPAAGDVFYVDSSGKDSNPGTEQLPWRTIQKAANSLTPGDTVMVNAGDYSTQRVKISRSGRSGAPITFQAQGQVVMKGFNLVANFITINGFEIANTSYRRWDRQTSAGIYVKGASNLIENNYIHDASLSGIYLFGTPAAPAVTHDNVIKNNRLYHNEMVGIEVNGRNNLIEGNEVWRTIQCLPSLTAVEDAAADNKGAKCPYYPAVTSLDGDGMRFFGQGHVFRRNKIHGLILDDTIDGIDVNPTPHIDCFQTWSGTENEAASNITFEQNYCENLNLGMYAFMLDGGADHIYIRNNVVNAYGGINANGEGRADYLYVYNNTWMDDLAYGPQGHPGAIVIAGIHTEIKNNIFFDQSEYLVIILGDTTNAVVDYNLAYNSDGSEPHCVKWGDFDTCQPASEHELWSVDPQFLDPANGDYHLRPTSLAVDAGVDLGLSVPNDLDGISRPQGTGYDMGAYEYNPAGSAGVPAGL